MISSRTRSMLTIAAVAITIALVSGCLWAPDLDQVRKELESQIPGASFKREFAISLGPVSLALARTVTRLVPDAREAHTYLEEIRHVRVAIYEIASMPEGSHLRMPRQMEELRSEGWEVAARVKEGNDHVWVLYREKKGKVSELFITVVGKDELVLVRADGHLDRLVEKAMANERLFSRRDIEFF